MKLSNLTLSLFLLTIVHHFIPAQTRPTDKFKQMYDLLPTPNQYRSANGAAGPEYWQQKADYKIKVQLSEGDQPKIEGSETITYYNNSPDPLEYLWLQLDQNVRSKKSQTYLVKEQKMGKKKKISSSRFYRDFPHFDGGFHILSVTGKNGAPMPYTIVHTMMRIDLKTPLKPGERLSFSVKWWYNINDREKIGGRSGYEYFEEENNYLFTIAQFYPRMCQYNDVQGWQHKQFLGRGEFTLTFGDYDLEITVPDNHLVAATGVLTNAGDILSKKMLKRLDKAEKSFDQPVLIATQKEAGKRAKKRAQGTKTWRFHADNVRDVAFASSAKFIWDAMNVRFEDGSTAMAMSMYPKEGNPLWEQFSTKIVAHTLYWYSHYTFPYPYPVAWSIHTKSIGMEYPMICFNGGRPEKDGTYSEGQRNGLIGVITHEVGHNFFPMIVNSDERQWTWMDEGLNTFVQHLTHQQWDRKFHGWYATPESMIEYMGGDQKNIRPIMTNSEAIYQFGYNAYAKPTVALMILRETVLGRELFDFAFKTYANRWKFKHPYPADFFRTMEDASGVDLDWFWRGWFYTTDFVDIGIDYVKEYRLNNKNPEQELALLKAQKAAKPRYIADIRNDKALPQTKVESDPHLQDFYYRYDPLIHQVMSVTEYEKYVQSLSDADRDFLQQAYTFYEIKFVNKGGLVMPLIVQFIYEDGTKEVIRIPAEIWKLHNDEVTRLFPTKKTVKQVVLDPFLETADVDKTNNYFPRKILKDRYELFIEKKRKSRPNPMQKAKSK